MMSKYYAQDCRNTIISILEDSTSGFDTKIATINTTRTHTAPSAKSIGYTWGSNQYPFLMVDVDNSEVDYDEADISLNLENLPEVHTILVMGFLKYTNDQLQNWVEDWIEAVIKTLHNYNDSNISWVAYTNTDRAELYKSENETIKSFVVVFEVRVN
jgi:hypothetical protein